MQKLKKPSLETVIIYPTLFLNLLFPFQSSGQQNFKEVEIDNDLQLIQIHDNFYVRTSWVNSERFGRFPSNGLLFIKNGKAIIIDTPMEESLTLELYNYLLDSMGITVDKFIACY